MLCQREGGGRVFNILIIFFCDHGSVVAPLRTTSAARALIPERSTVGPTGLYKSSSTDIQGAKGHECTTVLWPWIHSALSYVEVLWMRATNLWHDIASPPFLAILVSKITLVAVHCLTVLQISCKK